MHLNARPMRSAVAVLLSLSPLLAAAEPASTAAAPASSASASTSSSAASAAPAKSAQEVEIVDVSDQPDLHPQRLAVGAGTGPAWFTVKGAGAGVFAIDFTLHFDFGLGPGGDPTKWSLGPYIGVAYMPFGALPTPNRFTEFGARLVRRFESPMWVSAGLGLVFTNAPVVALTKDERAACAKGGGTADGIDCSVGAVLGAVLDLGIGLYEVRARTARWGLGARVPIQLSAHPGVGAVLFIYGLVGVAR